MHLSQAEIELIKDIKYRLLKEQNRNELAILVEKKIKYSIGSLIFDRIGDSEDSKNKDFGYAVLEEFLVKQEFDDLLNVTLENKDKFEPTKVLKYEKNKGEHGIIDTNYRRSKVFFLSDQFRLIFQQKILSYLPWILLKLKIDPFEVSDVEVQLTASNDNEFFKAHCDNAHKALQGRLITFVYYFYREPKAFTGGELKLFNTADIQQISNSVEYIIEPPQNSMIVFQSHQIHEVLPVICPTKQFEDSRFTLNGWVHKKKEK